MQSFGMNSYVFPCSRQITYFIINVDCRNIEISLIFEIKQRLFHRKYDGFKVPAWVFSGLVAIRIAVAVDEYVGSCAEVRAVVFGVQRRDRAASLSEPFAYRGTDQTGAAQNDDRRLAHARGSGGPGFTPMRARNHEAGSRKKRPRDKARHNHGKYAINERPSLKFVCPCCRSRQTVGTSLM